jgi:hypothetical protein
MTSGVMVVGMRRSGPAVSQILRPPPLPGQPWWVRVPAIPAVVAVAASLMF